MSTRATILVKFDNQNKPNGKTEKHLYHHWDGYILGVGKELVEVSEKILKKDLFSIEQIVDSLPRTFEDTKDVKKHTDREYHYDVEVIKDKEELYYKIYVINFYYDDEDGVKKEKERELIYYFSSEYGTKLINLH